MSSPSFTGAATIISSVALIAALALFIKPTGRADDARNNRARRAYVQTHHCTEITREAPDDRPKLSIEGKVVPQTDHLFFANTTYTCEGLQGAVLVWDIDEQSAF